MCPTGSTTISTTKKPGLRSAFEVLDVDHDGKISRDDLSTFYGHKLSSSAGEDDAIGSMMTVADSNKNGYVEFDEFEKVLAGDRQRSNGKRNGVMEEVFRVMDRDGDGKVGHEDLKSYLRLTGFEASDDDIKAMIRLGGGDDGVNFDGLCKILSV
ncbi:calcium-binding protein CP1 [Apium graveolens]|uniref:calcium-binding protein CP1 n=1 Tax=Apium graveolens TaxID=4045 RepID=UPI003D7B9B43